MDIFDLVLVAAQFGQMGQIRADINGDGAVNLQDLERVAEAFGNAAPSSQLDGLETFTAERVRSWLADAKGLDTTNTTVQRGILTLEQLLASLTEPPRIPTETAYCRITPIRSIRKPGYPIN